jgi:TolA-binding protein
MLDPNRFALDAATVGFRKRMRQAVNWDNFNDALQTQTESIKVRRELQETPISEVHIMGGQRYGFAGNSKTNEMARQERQMNGYPLRSFYATGGAIVLPAKHTEGLLATPMNVGLTSYAQYNGVVGNYVSSFTEPLNAPMDSGTMLMARAGIQARSEAINNPYKFLQFQLNMHATQEQIKQNEAKHQELRGYNQQGMIADMVTQENQQLKKVHTMNEIKKAGANRKPGSGVAVVGHLPNKFNDSTTQTPQPAELAGSSANVIVQNESENNPGSDLGTQTANLELLDPSGNVANLEENAAEIKQSGVPPISAMDELRDASDDDRQYMKEFEDAIIREGIRPPENEEEARGLMDAAMTAKLRGYNPAQFVHLLKRKDEDGRKEMELIFHAAGNVQGLQLMHDNPFFDHAGPTVPAAASALTLASTSEQKVLDGVNTVEKVVTALADADNQTGFGANGLQLQNGNLNSTPLKTAQSLGAFMMANMNSTPGMGLSTPQTMTPGSGGGKTEVLAYQAQLQNNKPTGTALDFSTPSAIKPTFLSQITSGGIKLKPPKPLKEVPPPGAAANKPLTMAEILQSNQKFNKLNKLTVVNSNNDDNDWD